MIDFVFLTTSDIHISDNGPRSRTDDFKETILGKISQLRIACSKLSADGAIIAGDLYNLKNPARNSHTLNQSLIKEFRKFPCPIYMIEGNHDLTANSLESLEQQPLGVLFADKTLIQLRSTIIEKSEVQADRFNLATEDLPKVKLSLVGVPYTENLNLKELKIPDKGDCCFQIGVMHLYAGSKPGMLYKERLYGYDELSILSPDLFVIGHYHVNQGIEQSFGKHFINLGSMSRGTQSDENIEHKPQIGYIKVTVDGQKVSCNAKALNLKVKPASEVFDLVKREAEIKENQEIQVFVERLASEAVNKGKMANKSMEEIIDSLNMAKVVKDKVMHYIQEATVA